MNNTIIFLRHAETKKDAAIPVSKWVLTERGKRCAKELAESGIFDDVDVIIVSGEMKSYQTALPFSYKTDKKIIRMPELNEINRDASGLMSKEEYDEMKRKIFEDLDFTDLGWESARHALERFASAIRMIDKYYVDKKILIVSHGTVMTLYFAHLQDKMNE
ncbi:MAG: histidine phosphatase family protein, partial [Candidatus Micrarchaeota archaeon]|nr:histidine phosphatase family protein [Candidatus Micrarchaeota archaeon]